MVMIPPLLSLTLPPTGFEKSVEMMIMMIKEKNYGNVESFKKLWNIIILR